MIADQMNLNLVYDTPDLQYTEVIDTKSDQALLPYTVGYIPWDWIKDSELFSWSAVNCQALYASGMRIFMTRAETDLTDLSATRGVPFLWALSAVLEGTTHNALYRDSDDQYVTDQSYANSLAFPNYSAIKKFDISGMANTSDTVHYVRYLCIYSLLDANGDMTSTGGCYGNRTAFHPFTKVIDTINLTCTLSGVTYTATFDTDKFKTVTSSTPYTETVQNGDASVKFLVYITGITCCTSRLTTSPTKQYITGLTIGQTRYRYPAMIGDQATNAYAYGRPMYRPFASDSATTSRYSGTGAYFAFSTQTQTYHDFLINKKHISADIFELSSRLYYSNADNFLVYNGGTEGSFAFYSYTYQDVCTLSMISQPAISYHGILYTQEFTDDYVLTGNWIPVTDGNKLVNPDTNAFDPDDIPDPDVPSDDGDDDTRKRNENTNLPEVDGIRLVSGTGFTSFYLLSAYHITELGQSLSSMPQTFWEALGTATDYKMSNLLSYISALKWYPLSILGSAPALYPDVPTSDIQFGFNATAKVPLSSAGSSYKLGTVNRVVSMGSVYIPYRSGTQTFLDLEPYTDVYINLPYIGKQQLQANQVLGYTVSVHYVVDLITGMCTCLVDNGYDTLFVGSGKIGVDIAVAGNDVITQSERMTSAYIGTVTHAISNSLSLGGAVAASEDASGAVAGFSGMISGLVSDCISTANAKRGVPQVVGGGSGFGSTYTAQTPCIIVQRPAVKLPASYGHSVGYVYNTYARIGTLSGYTVCDNPDLSGVPATSTELDMIRQILSTGFYA